MKQFLFFLCILITVWDISAQPIPVKTINGLPYIEVTINEKGPFLFGFDSGFGAELEIDAELAKELEINVSGQTTVGDGSGRNEIVLETGIVNKIAIGNNEIKKCTAILRSNTRKNVLGMENVKGIIGMGIFPEHLITIDYPQKLFTVEKANLPKANNKDIFVYEIVGGGVPQIKIKVGNHPLNAVIDTRSMSGTFKIPEEIAQKLHFISTPKLIGKGRTVSNTININQVQISESIQIGEFTFMEPVITYPSLNENAIIGAGFLQSFILRIDTKNHLVQLRKGAELQKDEQLSVYEGKFGDRIFTVEGSDLFVQRPGGMKLKMQKKEDDTFTLEAIPNAILKFERNENNIVNVVKVSKGDGVWETAIKSL